MSGAPQVSIRRSPLTDGRDEPVGMFVRREVMDQVDGYTVHGLHRDLYEDIALNVKICLRHPVIASDRSWYRYRQHPDSYCSVARKQDEYETGALRFLEWVGAHLTENRVSDAELWDILRKALERQRAVTRG